MMDDGQIIDNVNFKSVSCENIPEDFLDKLVTKQHFGQYGKIKRCILRPKRYACTIEYETSEAAENAILDGGIYNGHQFDIFYTPKEISKPKSSGEWLDPDVQAELEAMGALVQSKPAPNKSRSAIGADPVSRKTDMFSLPRNTVKLKSNPEISLSKTSNVFVNPTVKAELEAIMRKSAFTSEEKYRVLEARDKLLRLTMVKTTDIKKAVSTQGLCPDMCPEKERLMREAKHQVASFELEENSRHVMNHLLAVKQYSRSSADQESPLAHELRPEPVLRMTMAYLLHRIVNLCDMSDVNISDWYHFLWDRTRSIRKDITQQELCSQGSVLLVEQCARFHIHCSARLIAEEPSVFDQKINTENLTKCLQSLKYMYHDLALKGIRCPNEAEFRAYIILLNLNDGNFLWEVKQLPKDIQKSEEIRFALDVYLAIESGNYVKFFQLVRRTTYMNACILLRYFNQVRSRALLVILKAYTIRAPVYFSISYLTYIWAFEDDDTTILFLEYHGLQCDRNEDRVSLDKNCFFQPTMPFLLDRAIYIVEHKRTCSVGEAIFGGPLESVSSFEKHEPHDSFDENGYLLEEAWQAEDQNYLKPPTPKRKTLHTPFRDEIDNKEENLFKIPSGSPPISPKPTNAMYGRVAGNIFQSRLGPKTTTISDAAPKIITTVSSNSGTKTQSTDNIFSPLNTSETKSNTAFNIFSHAAPIQKPKFDIRIPSSGGSNSGNTQFLTSNSSVGIFGGKSSTNFTNIPIVSKPINIFGGASSAFSAVPAKTTNVTVFSENTAIFSSTAASPNIGTTQVKLVDPRIEKQNTELLKKKAEIEKLQRDKEEEIERQKEAALKRQEELRIQIETKKKRDDMLHKIEKKSDEFLQQVLENFLAEDVFRIATEELQEFQRFLACTELLTNNILKEVVEELLRRIIAQEILIKQAEQMRDFKILHKYFHTWQNNVRKIVKKRHIIENTPVWLVDKSIEDRASELHHPLQEVTLEHMRRYRRGVPNRLQLYRTDEGVIDLFETVGQHLVFAHHKQNSPGMMRNNLFWKMVISIPSREEESSGFYDYIEKWLSNFLKRRKPHLKNYFFLEQRVPINCQDIVTICLRKLSGDALMDESDNENGSSGNNLNALLFIMTSKNYDNSKKRLEAILDKSEYRSPIPVSIVLYNSGHVQVDDVKILLNLDDLVDSGHILEYTIKIHDETGRRFQKSLLAVVDDCLRFCAKNFNAVFNLEMQRTTSFLSEMLGDQFWNRISISANVNPSLAGGVRNINFVVALYNEAIDRIIKICGHDYSSYNEFPEEFRPLVSHQFFDIPQKLEHFPVDWKHPERMNKIKKFLTSLKLKRVPFLADSLNIEKLHLHIRDYVKSILSDQHERITYSIMEIILQTQRHETILWLRPVQKIAQELLSQKWKSSFSNLPCEIIYHRIEYGLYTTTPWWLTMNNLLRNIQIVDEDTEIQSSSDADEPEIKRTKLMMCTKSEIDDILKQANLSLAKADKKLEKFKEITESAWSISRNLDLSLFKQESAFRQIKRICQKNLRR